MKTNKIIFANRGRSSALSVVNNVSPLSPGQQFVLRNTLPMGRGHTAIHPRPELTSFD